MMYLPSFKWQAMCNLYEFDAGQSKQQRDRVTSRSMTRPALGDVLVEQGIAPKLTVEQTLSRLEGSPRNSVPPCLAKEQYQKNSWRVRCLSNLDCPSTR